MNVSSPFTAMQHAVDFARRSEHSTSKIGAMCIGTKKDGDKFETPATNYWPPPIVRAFGRDVRIGNASGTIHAETAALLQAPRTQESALYVTDPPCPNCVKNMAEAGIQTLYIDDEGFEKDFARRRGHHFETMSMRIAEQAGMAVIRINRSKSTSEIIYEPPADYKPALENPVLMTLIPAGEGGRPPADYAKALTDHAMPGIYAYAMAKDADGSFWFLMAEPHPVLGFTSATLEQDDGKYSFWLQPLNRLLMTAARHGLRIEDGTLFSSRVPTAREMVDMIGAGLTGLSIGDNSAARDPHSSLALKQLTDAGVLKLL